MLQRLHQCVKHDRDQNVHARFMKMFLDEGGCSDFVHTIQTGPVTEVVRPNVIIRLLHKCSLNFRSCMGADTGRLTEF